MSDYQDQIRRYLRFVMSALELSPSALAKRAGIASTTLTRFLNSSDHKFTISNTTLQKIANVSEISISPFLDTGRAPESRAYTEFSIKHSKSKDIDPDDGFASIIEYEVNPGHWVDRNIYERNGIILDIGLPSISDTTKNFYALVSGSSIEEIAKEGEYLYCRRVMGEAAVSSSMIGFVWIVERETADGLLIECSARSVSVAPQGLEFEFLTRDSRFSDSRLLVKVEEFERPPLRIKGMVLSVVRRINRYKVDDRA